MVLNQLSIYDIIADTIPGILFVLVIVSVSSVSLNYPTSGVSSGLLIIFLGYVAGRIIHGITGWLENIAADGMRWNEEIDEWNQETDEDMQIDWDELNIDIENRADFAQRAVYGKVNLYSRYNMLYIFHRNLGFVFYVSTVVYFLSYIGVLNNYSIFSHNQFLIIAFISFLAAVVSAKRMGKFANKVCESLPYDVYLELEERELL